MFTQNAPDSAIAGHDFEFNPGKNPTSGGSREIELNEPMVSP
jgi:hypothetical protein